MEVYSNKEKQSVLERIVKGAPKGSCEFCKVIDDKEQSIVETSLEPIGLVKVWGRNSGLDCELTEKGYAFMKKGGFNQFEVEEQSKREMDNLTKENIKLTNKKLRFELRTRWIAVISLIVSIIGLVISILTFVCHPIH